MKGFLLLVVVGMVIFVGPMASARADEAGEHDRLRRHRLTAGFGYTFVREAVGVNDAAEADKGVWVPTGNVEYAYRLNHRWAVGGVVDLEFADYLIFKEDLTRDKALIIAALAYYEAAPSWELFAGGGVELESSGNLAVIRFGTAYAFDVSSDGWIVSPGVVYDIKEGYDALSFIVGVGKSW